MTGPAVTLKSILLEMEPDIIRLRGLLRALRLMTEGPGLLTHSLDGADCQAVATVVNLAIDAADDVYSSWSSGTKGERP